MITRDRTIDTAKGIAIILVVWGHIIQRNLILGGADFFLDPVYKWIYMFHMPLFFFIGGYLMAGSLKNKSPASVFFSRCRGLLIPFFFWAVLDAFTSNVLCIVDGKTGFGHFSRDILEQLVFKPSVWVLSTFFLLSALLLVCIWARKRLGMIVWLMVPVLFFLAPGNQYGGLYYAQWFLPFYAAGYLVQRRHFVIRFPWLRMVFRAVALAGLLVLGSFWIESDYIYNNKMLFHAGMLSAEGIRLLYRYLVGFLGIYLVWDIAVFFSTSSLGTALGLLGMYSLDIYMLQRYLVEGLYPRLVIGLHGQADLQSPVRFYAYVFFLGLVFAAICVVLSRFIIRRNKWLNIFLLGARG
ncbi:MAG: acyltransferase family protein [Candidatus Omnitrophica bacterium]|nr:acyltransferase family protein [Candidatus Omnitrophota bacterium]